jgi:hypothetical protein
MTYRGDEEFKDFIEYNDVGLPLAYFIDNKIVESTNMAQRFIEETFDIFISSLDLEDTGFDNLDDLLEAGSKTKN